MNKSIIHIVLVIAGLSPCGQRIFAQQEQSGRPLPKYLDPNAPIEQRIDDLLPRLTLDEKVIELSDSWGSKGIPRLKIPAMLKTEGLHGQSYSTGATIYPMPISMSSTFDTALIYKVGQATAVEARAAGLLVSWSPVLDVARDARWGRVEETYGEDAFWVSRMGVAWIKGFQEKNMIAVAKHFAGHGSPLGGRDSHDQGLSDRVMRNINLIPFRAAIEEAHAGGVMAAYSTWDGVPDNASVELLQNILREEWGFDGIVESDCGAPENLTKKQYVAADPEEAAKLAILAGVDNECGSVFVKSLAAAIRDGKLAENDLDPNLRCILRAKFRLGLFDHPAPDTMVWDKLPAYDVPERRALAREVSVEGSVLLQNNDHVLPLSKDLSTIAVIGPNAGMAQTGDYSAKAAAGQLVTVLQGVKTHVGPHTTVLYAMGCPNVTEDSLGIAGAVDLARRADAVILVVGDNSRSEVGESTSGENRDGATLEIPGAQRQLIRAIYATGKPIVLVLVNGKPFTLAWEAAHIPAILETWYSGEEGGNATADLIFGDRNPSGRLPISFPRHPGQLPLTYDYLPSGRGYDYYDIPFSPQYRFGHGLSYTRFRYANLVATPHPDDPGFVTVSADITNTGERDGDEVAQLYITDMLSSVITPVISLRGISRVSLKKGETKTVSFELEPYQLSLLDADMVRVLETGRFRVHVGGECPAPPAGSDEHKQKIGYTGPTEGISGEFVVSKPYRANFIYTLHAPATAKSGEPFSATITVENQGNLTDVASIRLFCESLIGAYRFEIKPGETKSHSFNVSLYKGGEQQLVAIVGKEAVSRPVKVIPAHIGSKHSLHSQFESYKGLVMAGYQGWFNAPDDGAARGWNHYHARGAFEPGNCKFDLWPDVSEYKKTYPSPFTHADGTRAYLFSSYDASTTDLHFKWMQQYGIDGVFVQRFVTNLKSAVSLHANNTVLAHALEASRKYGRAIAVMYDMSGMNDSTDADLVISDWKNLVDSMRLTGRGDRQTYLYHRGRPLVVLWGAGFNDHRAYGPLSVQKIMDFLQHDPAYGGCSVMLGVPTYWRDQGNDASKDGRWMDLFRRSDILQPWMVGRYNEDSYLPFSARVAADIIWCKAHGIDYVPVVFPGFSWHNMNNAFPQNQILRDRGRFFWEQIKGDLQAGAEMLYVAMFDEIDEGTAIFKISPDPPVGKSTFVSFEPGIPSDYYLDLAGYAGAVLRRQAPMEDQPPAPASFKKIRK